jgi:hypothetical protein
MGNCVGGVRLVGNCGKLLSQSGWADCFLVMQWRNADSARVTSYGQETSRVNQARTLWSEEGAAVGGGKREKRRIHCNTRWEFNGKSHHLLYKIPYY